MALVEELFNFDSSYFYTSVVAYITRCRLLGLDESLFVWLNINVKLLLLLSIGTYTSCKGLASLMLLPFVKKVMLHLTPYAFAMTIFFWCF